MLCLSVLLFGKGKSNNEFRRCIRTGRPTNFVARQFYRCARPRFEHKGVGRRTNQFHSGYRLRRERKGKRERKRDAFVIHKGMFWILLLYSQFVVEIEGIILSGQMWNGGTKTIFDLISGKIRQIALPSNSRFSSMIELCYFFSLFLSLRPGYIVMRKYQFFKYNLDLNIWVIGREWLYEWIKIRQGKFERCSIFT